MIINEQKFINIKNLNIKRYEIRLSIIIDDIDFIKYIMNNFQKYHKDLKIELKLNLFAKYINMLIYFDYYTLYKLNNIKSILMETYKEYLKYKIS